MKKVKLNMAIKIGNDKTIFNREMIEDLKKKITYDEAIMSLIRITLENTEAIKYIKKESFYDESGKEVMDMPKKLLAILGDKE